MIYFNILKSKVLVHWIEPTARFGRIVDSDGCKNLEFFTVVFLLVFSSQISKVQEINIHYRRLLAARFSELCTPLDTRQKPNCNLVLLAESWNLLCKTRIIFVNVVWEEIVKMCTNATGNALHTLYVHVLGKYTKNANFNSSF